MKLFLMTLLLIATNAVAAPPQGSEPLPPGWQYADAPKIKGFDPDLLTESASKLLGGKKEAISLMPMNSRAPEGALAEIMEGLTEFHSRNEPVLLVSRDVKFIADALRRALIKFKGADLMGLRVVIAAPERPAMDFLELLHARKIEYFYMQVEPSN